MWLLHFIFYCKTLKVAKRFLTLANQLYYGRNIGLRQLILGSPYESLGLATHTPKNLGPTNNPLIIDPYLLFRLWLNATFESSYQVDIPNNQVKQIKNRKIEGTRIALMTPTDIAHSMCDTFTEYFMMFPKLHSFTPLVTPFTNRSHEP